MIIGKLLNAIHLFGFFLPLFIPLFFSIGLKNFFKPVLKLLLLMYVLVPMHWIFCDNKCFLTHFTKQMGEYKGSKSKYQFLESNLKWLYKPIMDLIGLKWLNDNDMRSVLVGHIFINIIILWYYLFYVY